MNDLALTTPAQLGAAIRGARTRAGMTQEALARRAGVSRRWLIALETGHGERAELGKILDTLDALDLTLTSRVRASDARSKLDDILGGR